MIFDIDRMAQTPGVIDVATISGGMHERRPGKGIDEAISRLGVEATTQILRLVDESLKTANALGFASIRLYVHDLSIVIDARSVPDHGVECIAVTLPVGHPQTKSLARMINRCWGQKPIRTRLPAANDAPAETTPAPTPELGEPRVLNPDATEAAY